MCTAIDKCDASLYPGAVAGHGLCGDGASCIVTGPGTYQCSVLRFWVVEHGRGFAMLAALWLICLAGFGLLERIPRAFVGFLTVRRAQCAALEARAPRKATTGRRESPPALSLLLFISFVCHLFLLFISFVCHLLPFVRSFFFSYSLRRFFTMYVISLPLYADWTQAVEAVPLPRHHRPSRPCYRGGPSGARAAFSPSIDPHLDPFRHRTRLRLCCSNAHVY